MTRSEEAGEPELIVIHDLKEIPAFADEAEEQEYWATHRLSEELWMEGEDE